MATYQDVQMQMQQQMQQQGASRSESALKDSAKEMSKAAQNMQMTSMSQNQQTLSITQAIQAQQQSIHSMSMTIGNLANTMKGVGSTAVSFAGSNISSNLRSNIADPLMSVIRGNQGIMRGVGAPGTQPGFLHVPQAGMLRSAVHGFGEGFNPANAMSYTLGASQAAWQRQAGHGAAGFAQGIIKGVGGFGVDAIKGSIGGAVGQALIPIPVVGGMVGSMLGSMAPDPFSYGMGEMSRMNALGGAASRGAYSFLRGASMGGIRASDIGIRQEAAIGRGIARDTFMDLTYSTQDMNELQGMFAQSGHMMGANDPQKYVKKFRELLDTHKSVAKVLQMSTTEAAEFMSTVDYGSGLNAKNQIGRVYAAAHLGGMSPGQVASMMQSGARGFANMGLTAPTGALAMQSSIGTAGALYSSGNISNSMYATLGGEQGMRDVLQRAQGQFLSGPGGMMALFNQAGQGTLSQRLSRTASSMSKTDNLINYMANSDQMIEDMMKNRGPSGMQSEMLAEIYRYAKELDANASGAKLRNLMIISAQSLGYAKTQTEAKMLIESIPEVKRAVSQQQAISNQAASDMARDLAGERFGIRGRIKTFGRRVAERTGGVAVANLSSEFSADVGQRFENFSRNLTNRFWNIDETRVNRSLAGKIAESSDSEISELLGLKDTVTGLSRTKDLDEKMMGLTMGYTGTSGSKRLGDVLSRGAGLFGKASLAGASDVNQAMLSIDYFRRTGKVLPESYRARREAGIEGLKAAGYDVDPSAMGLGISAATSFYPKSSPGGRRKAYDLTQGEFGRRQLGFIEEVLANPQYMSQLGVTEGEMISLRSNITDSAYTGGKSMPQEERADEIRNHLNIGSVLGDPELIANYNEPEFQEFLKILQNHLRVKGSGTPRQAQESRKKLDDAIRLLLSSSSPGMRELVSAVLKANDQDSREGENYTDNKFSLEREAGIESHIEKQDLKAFSAKERRRYDMSATRALSEKGYRSVAGMYGIKPGSMSFKENVPTAEIGIQFASRRDQILEAIENKHRSGQQLSDIDTDLRRILRENNEDYSKLGGELASNFVKYGGGDGLITTGVGAAGSSDQIGAQSAAKLSEFISTQTKILETIAGDLGVK